MRGLLYPLFLLYAFLLPFERILRFVSASAEDSIFKPYRIVAFVIFAVWLGWMAQSGRTYRPDTGDKTFYAIFSYGTVMALFWHAVAENDLDYTWKALQLILIALAVYVVAKDARFSPKEIRGIFVAYALGLFIAFAWSMVLQDSISGRLRGFYKNPNQLGVAGSVCFLFFFAQFVFSERPRITSQIARVGLAVGALALTALSGSRGATFAALGGTLVLLFFAFSKRQHARSRGPRLFGFAALCIVVALSSFDSFDAAFQQTDSSTRFRREEAAQSAEGRWSLWVSGMNVGVDHFGIGAGTSQYFSHHLSSVKELRGYVDQDLEGIVLGTHSDFVDLFASYGVLGLVLYLLYNWKAAKNLLQRTNDQSTFKDAPYLRPFGLALLTHLFVVSISQNSFTGPEYFLCFAMADWIGKLSSAAAAKAPGKLIPGPRQVAALEREQPPRLRGNRPLVEQQGRA